MTLSYVHLFEPGADPAAPPLLLLHGTGGNERDLVRIGHSLSPGSALLSPRGNVSESGALRFYSRLAEGVFDPAEVTRRTLALADFIAAACKQYDIDRSRLTAVGFSNGANVAVTLLQLRPESLGAAILFRPMVVLDQPAANGSLTDKRALILNGNVDPIVPLPHQARLTALLQAGGATVTTQLIPASHNLTPADLAAAKQWLAAA
jgi:phospholipase/carboxylesterase